MLADLKVVVRVRRTSGRLAAWCAVAVVELALAISLGTVDGADGATAGATVTVAEYLWQAPRTTKLADLLKNKVYCL